MAKIKEPPTYAASALSILLTKSFPTVGVGSSLFSFFESSTASSTTLNISFPHRSAQLYTTLWSSRHSGMDSRQAILPDALRVNANLFQTDLCRNPGTGMYYARPSLALDTGFPAGMTILGRTYV
jgi:hypothetical protein